MARGLRDGPGHRLIQPGRGFDEAARILGADFAGVLVRDGWGPYRRFPPATHQTCLGHLLRRCHESLETALRGTARFHHAVKALLQDALALRDRRARDELSPHGFAVVRGRLETRCDRLLGWQPTDNDNRTFVAHLVRERDALFTFLYRPEVPATNWAAEQAIRPAVATRKVCGGNRTWRGAHTQEVIASVLRTAFQQGHDVYTLIVSLLRAPTPRVADRRSPAPGSVRGPAPLPLRSRRPSPLAMSVPLRPSRADRLAGAHQASNALPVHLALKLPSRPRSHTRCRTR